MSQTLAIFYDAYRGLRARKMFWIVLGISALIVVSFGCIGITERGLKILVWEFDFALTTNEMSPAVFYKTLFVSLGVDFWLSWLAAILALISTAGIFPAFIAGGSIDLVVARPIGRSRLFLTQYAAGLLFVMLQITIFCGMSFLVIGLRGGAWEPGIFLAIPLVVCFFSYLFSVCVLLGVMTRSAVAALLLTILFWLLLAGLHSTDMGLLAAQMGMQQEQRERQAEIKEMEAEIQAIGPGAETPSASAGNRPDQPAMERELKNLRRQYDEMAGTIEKIETVHRIIYGIKTFLPKTTETVGLLGRTLIRRADLPDVEGGASANVRDAPAKRLVRAIRSRSVWWIIGTSLAFELVVLAAAGWIFCRRDF